MTHHLSVSRLFANSVFQFCAALWHIQQMTQLNDHVTDAFPLPFIRRTGCVGEVLLFVVYFIRFYLRYYKYIVRKG